MQDQSGEAIADLEKVISLRANDASAHNALGVALARDNKFSHAISELKTARRLEPGNTKYDKNLACIESHLQGCTLSL